MFKGKKGFITHPIIAIIIGFLLGMLVMFLIARGIIPTPLNVCP
jgi:hypothetical protein